ncbi:unnamed protein product [Staurois parvus]|uniref:Uncharacterized protein n=1 Tax=Staurois parvus TaxID=386267 RepID=A0ABN9C9K4_9NEOB|nr:unnamed protein product [Staurois parvus]
MGGRTVAIGSRNCPSSLGVNNASLALGGRIVSYSWCKLEKECPIVGVSGKNIAPLLVSVGGIVPHGFFQ